MPIVVRPRLLCHRQRHVSALGPSEEIGDRWTVPVCAQPHIRRCRRICCWLELDRWIEAHGRVCGGARRWLSSASHLYEEPTLARLFGIQWHVYGANVNRWWPEPPIKSGRRYA